MKEGDRQVLRLMVIFALLTAAVNLLAVFVEAYSDVTVDINRPKECTEDGPCGRYLNIDRCDTGVSGYVNVTHTGRPSGPWTFFINTTNIENLTVDVDLLYTTENAEGNLFTDQTTAYYDWLNAREQNNIVVDIVSSCEMLSVELQTVPEPLGVTWDGLTMTSPDNWTYDSATDTITTDHPQEGTHRYIIWYRAGTVGGGGPGECGRVYQDFEWRQELDGMMTFFDNTESERPVISHKWDFGDGTGVEKYDRDGAVETHRYRVDGLWEEFEVVLTVGVSCSATAVGYYNVTHVVRVYNYQNMLFFIGGVLIFLFLIYYAESRYQALGKLKAHGLTVVLPRWKRVLLIGIAVFSFFWFPTWTPEDPYFSDAFIDAYGSVAYLAVSFLLILFILALLFVGGREFSIAKAKVVRRAAQAPRGDELGTAAAFRVVERMENALSDAMKGLRRIRGGR